MLFENAPTTSTFCCCFSLKSGAYFIGFLQFVFGLLGEIFIVLSLLFPEEYPRYSRIPFNQLMLTSILYGFTSICGILLLIAVIMNVPKHIMECAAVQLSLMLNGFMTFLSCIVCFSFHPHAKSAGIPISMVAQQIFVWNIYFSEMLFFEIRNSFLTFLHFQSCHSTFGLFWIRITESWLRNAKKPSNHQLLWLKHIHNYFFWSIKICEGVNRRKHGIITIQIHI